MRFLAREASWMTGQTIYVDGGFLAAGLPLLEELVDAHGAPAGRAGSANQEAAMSEPTALDDEVVEVPGG